MEIQIYKLHIYTVISRDFLFVPYYANFLKTFESLVKDKDITTDTSNIIYTHYASKHPFNINLTSITDIDDILYHKIQHNVSRLNVYEAKYQEYKHLLLYICDHCKEFKSYSKYDFATIYSQIDNRRQTISKETISKETISKDTISKEHTCDMIQSQEVVKNKGKIKRYTKKGTDNRFVHMTNNMIHVLRILDTELSEYEKIGECISFRLFMKQLLLFVKDESLQHGCNIVFDPTRSNERQKLVKQLLQSGSTESNVFDLRTIEKYVNVFNSF